MQCSALIIDDEPLARKRLRTLLEPFSGEIEILGEAGSGAQAVEMIHDLAPDVVFLDIQMPDMDAFDVLHKLDADFVPKVIFTTAYEDFAVKAFEENTVDYLLKPIDSDRLAGAIEKLRQQSMNQIAAPEGFSWDQLRKLVNLGGEYMQRFLVRFGDRVLFINADEVIRFRSEDKYTYIHTVNGQYIIGMTLADLEKKLDPSKFIRVHRAHLISLDYIMEYRKYDVNHVEILLKDANRTKIVANRNWIKKIQNI